MDQEAYDRREQAELNRRFQFELLATFGLKWGDYFHRIEKQFGGAPDCLFNLVMFNSRVTRRDKNGPARISCPPGDHYYPRFQTLLKNKVITEAGPDLYEFQPLPGQVLPGAVYAGPETYSVPSLTDPGQEYTVDVKAWTCTCPDWQKRHNQAEAGHPSGLCKHLLLQVAEHPELMTPAMRPYGLIMSDRYRHGRGMPSEGAAYGEIADNDDGITYGCIIEPGNEGWINFLIDDKRYGYNLAEKRWARGEKPAISRHLLAQVKKLGIKPLSEGGPAAEWNEPKRERPAKEKAEAQQSGSGNLVGIIIFAVILFILIGKCVK